MSRRGSWAVCDGFWAAPEGHTGGTSVIQLLARLLGRSDPSPDVTPSREVARERLRLMLVHDRADVDPAFLDALKDELIRVISRYVEIDREGVQVNFHREEGAVALIANMPVRSVHRQRPPMASL